MKKMNHGSAVALVRKDGAVLLQLRENRSEINYPNHWCLPGGHVEEGEDFKLAAVRELKEETNYSDPDVKLLVEEQYTNDRNIVINRHIYWAKYDGKQKLKCFEGSDLKFVKPSDFEGLVFIPGHDRIGKMASELVVKTNKY